MTTLDYIEPHRLIPADPEIAARLTAKYNSISHGESVSSSTRAGLAIGGAAIAMAAVANSAFGQGNLPRMVTDILNFALTLEYLESEFYVKGVGTAGLIPSGMAPVFDQIRKHEVAHVQFLKSVLGSNAVAKPNFDFTAHGAFSDVFSNFKTFATLAQAFEDTGVRAYKGQAANLIGHNDVLLPALRIHSVEARHASQVRRMRGQKGWITGNSRGDMPAATQGVYEGDNNKFQFILAQIDSHDTALTEGFDEPLTKGQVLEIVKPFMTGGVQ